MLHLCDVLNKILAEGESAAYEPHGDHMVGQRHNILVEPGGNGSNMHVRESVCAAKITHVHMREHLLRGVCVGQGDGKHTNILFSYKVGIQMGQAHQSCETEQKINNIKYLDLVSKRENFY